MLHSTRPTIHLSCTHRTPRLRIFTSRRTYKLSPLFYPPFNVSIPFPPSSVGDRAHTMRMSSNQGYFVCHISGVKAKETKRNAASISILTLARNKRQIHVSYKLHRLHFYVYLCLHTFFRFPTHIHPVPRNPYQMASRYLSQTPLSKRKREISKHTLNIPSKKRIYKLSIGHSPRVSK